MSLNGRERRGGRGRLQFIRTKQGRIASGSLCFAASKALSSLGFCRFVVCHKIYGRKVWVSENRDAH
jgi:hypothetical protein